MARKSSRGTRSVKYGNWPVPQGARKGKPRGGRLSQSRAAEVDLGMNVLQAMEQLLEDNGGHRFRQIALVLAINHVLQRRCKRTKRTWGLLAEGDAGARLDCRVMPSHAPTVWLNSLPTCSESVSASRPALFLTSPAICMVAHSPLNCVPVTGGCTSPVAKSITMAILSSHRTTSLRPKMCRLPALSVVSCRIIMIS